ncbi:MAG: hypothetical protein BGO07_04370 [Alphaproteobacteria bacterium 40-19]|nr:MAG: hypothetical protein BGO07_04370 [Alphaproteobacteria bacterium 40-19]
MNKKIFFILLINYFFSSIYAAQEVQKTQSSKLSFNRQEQSKAPNYLSPTQSSQASSVSQPVWQEKLRSGETLGTNEKLNQQFPVKPKEKKNKEKVLTGPITLDAKTKAEAYLKDLQQEESFIPDILKKDKTENKNNKKEEILKKIMQLDQEIVAIENQIIKFEHYNIKEHMNASDREELKKPMKKFKDEKMEEKKKLEAEFRNLEEKFPEENFGKGLLSQLGKKIQEDAIKHKAYDIEISHLLKKEQEKKEKEQKSQKEPASKKGFLGSIKSFFK